VVSSHLFYAFFSGSGVFLCRLLLLLLLFLQKTVEAIYYRFFMQATTSTEVSSLSDSCNCTGIRFCAKCRNTQRVQDLFSGSVPLSTAQSVIDKQKKQERLSSCSFATIGKSAYSCCPTCLAVFTTTSLLKTCNDHCGLVSSELRISGLYIFENIVSAEEESRIIEFLDNPAPFPLWIDSQSGRRKQDYGPRRNFKKKKVKPAKIPSMPLAFKPVFGAIMAEVEKCTNTPYKIAEVSVLEYTEGNLSNFDPHVDDTWLWGDRIAGLNLNSECAMTFVNSEGDCCDVFFPQRSFFLMSGECRYNWMHGIRPDRVHGRRISLTFRELSAEILSDKAASDMVLSAAANFV
jgi:DNA N6-methyl adenine demethylase